MTTIPYETLKTGSNIVEWLLIINSWSGGMLGFLFFSLITILLFAIFKFNNAGTEDAIIAASFIGFLVSGLAWLVRWNGYILVHTSLPVFLIVLCGIGIILKISKGWLNG